MPLLPTPPTSVRNFNYRNHYKQHITGPTTVNSSRTHIPFKDHQHSTVQYQPSQAPLEFQDLIPQDSTTNNHHYFQDHHANHQEFHHKTISTASTATRTLYTACISTTVCSNHNINSIQPNKQCILANQTNLFNPTPVQ